MPTAANDNLELAADCVATLMGQDKFPLNTNDLDPCSPDARSSANVAIDVATKAAATYYKMVYCGGGPDALGGALDVMNTVKDNAMDMIKGWEKAAAGVGACMAKAADDTINALKNDAGMGDFGVLGSDPAMIVLSTAGNLAAGVSMSAQRVEDMYDGISKSLSDAAGAMGDSAGGQQKACEQAIDAAAGAVNGLAKKAVSAACKPFSTKEFTDPISDGIKKASDALEKGINNLIKKYLDNALKNPLKCIDDTVNENVLSHPCAQFASSMLKSGGDICAKADPFKLALSDLIGDIEVDINIGANFIEIAYKGLDGLLKGVGVCDIITGRVDLKKAFADATKDLVQVKELRLGDPTTGIGVNMKGWEKFNELMGNAKNGYDKANRGYNMAASSRLTRVEKSYLTPALRRADAAMEEYLVLQAFVLELESKIGVDLVDKNNVIVSTVPMNFKGLAGYAPNVYLTAKDVAGLNIWYPTPEMLASNVPLHLIEFDPSRVNNLINITCAAYNK